ncbi:MAG TPA: glycosyltransferase [Candidatus Competibacteraceae bacterium]|nr:glycosyltransferase [Candidatus Competibacteraceae bacterium]MCP5132583.1 glycosyltransferase [Gammaproteobacteria bacterium]HPF57646.1 glycosyltransferase [Candidatus Competibacteraceae bacterium]HRY16969.1 glycosyltransferase [Candidatus Competibacteraceae bacterium]
MTLRAPRIAVLIPCYNEAAAITTVVQNFQAALPDARIYVYDNNSVDQTADRARAAGAIVRRERQQGKGHVVRRMFGDVEADVYVLVDGDGTYDAASAPRLVQHLLNEQLDMVNAARVEIEEVAYRPGHRFGNVLLTRMVGLIFGDQIKDMLSGYRVFSRRFVKSFPALSTGFEIETELTVHALELHMPIAEMQTPYRARPAGSLSKLHTFRDGFRILATIALLVRDERPLPFFTVLFALLTMVSVVLAWPIVLEFMVTGLVPRFPTAILSTGLVLLAFLSLACGIILDTVTLGRREIKRLHYLGISGTASELND